MSFCSVEWFRLGSAAGARKARAGRRRASLSMCPSLPAEWPVAVARLERVMSRMRADQEEARLSLTPPVEANLRREVRQAPVAQRQA